MLTIKLRPIGKKKQISYRVAVMEKRSKLKGKFVEDLGWYNPHTDASKINKERATHWIAQGVQPTDSVHNLLVREGIIEGKKIPVHAKSKKEPADTQGSGEAKPVAQEAPATPETAPQEEPEVKTEEATEDKPSSADLPAQAGASEGKEEVPAPASAEDSSGEVKEEPKEEEKSAN